MTRDVGKDGCKPSMLRRITLRPIDSGDTADILRWRNCDAVMQQFLIRTPLDAATHERWLKEKVATGQVRQFILLDETGRGIGSVYLRDIDMAARKAEMGIFIGEDAARGKGYGVEAVEAIVEYGFQALGLHRIYLRVLETNEKAIRVYERAGFRVEGVARDDVRIGSAYQSVVWMARLKEEREA